MSTPIVIVGCGGFGRQVHDVVDAINGAAASAGRPTVWEVLGYLDDAPSELDRRRVEARGARLLDAVSAAAAFSGAAYVLGVGDGAVRERLAGELDAAGLQAALLVHPSVTAGVAVTLGAGTVLCDGVRLMNEIELGRHVHVNLNSTVGHDCVLEDFCTVYPLVAVSGNCRIGARAALGAHSVVLPGLSVGADAVVGAAACVVRDVAVRAVVKGVPAR